MTVVAQSTSTPRRESAAAELVTLELADLIESPWNPREHYDPAKIAELASSLRSQGQLTPLLVRPLKNGRFEIAAGHRRFRAAARAGLKMLLAVVREMDDATFTEALNVENLERADLHPLEEATGFRDLMERAGYDVAKIAARIGRSERYVYDRVKLLQLTPRAKKLFLAGAFEAGHAILLARLTAEQQERAIGDLEDVADSGEYAAHRVSLLLRPDSGADGELPLHDKVKPVSVREFQHAIEHEMRATPDRVDPFLFPQSAIDLEKAKEEKLSVIHITREYRVSDQARDEKIKTYGSEAWKRADGFVEEDRYGHKVKSKPCTWSRYGFVVAGAGQGEVFRVCVNKQKCATHWPEHVKRAKAAAKGTKSGSKDTAKPGVDRLALEEQRHTAELEERQAERKRWEKAVPALAKALAAKLQAAPISKIISIVLERRFSRQQAIQYMPDVRGPVEVLRHLAFDELNERILDDWDLSETGTKALKPFGIDAQKIVDQVAPKPKAEAPKPPARKGKGK